MSIRDIQGRLNSLTTHADIDTFEGRVKDFLGIGARQQTAEEAAAYQSLLKLTAAAHRRVDVDDVFAQFALEPAPEPAPQPTPTPTPTPVEPPAPPTFAERTSGGNYTGDAIYQMWYMAAAASYIPGGYRHFIVFNNRNTGEFKLFDDNSSPDRVTAENTDYRAFVNEAVGKGYGWNQVDVERAEREAPTIWTHVIGIQQPADDYAGVLQLFDTWGDSSGYQVVYRYDTEMWGYFIPGQNGAGAAQFGNWVSTYAALAEEVNPNILADDIPATEDALRSSPDWTHKTRLERGTDL